MSKYPHSCTERVRSPRRGHLPRRFLSQMSSRVKAMRPFFCSIQVHPIARLHAWRILLIRSINAVPMLTRAPMTVSLSRNEMRQFHTSTECLLAVCGNAQTPWHNVTVS